jgi:two-component system chemotaxis sensor kinase CheA
LAAGKPRGGVIRLAATQRGGSVMLDLSDDGAGLDLAQIRNLAGAKQLLSEEQAAALSEQRAMDLIFQPGFTTRQTVTETSGRGVGMDVVRKHVEQLGGQIRVSSMCGRGTRFAISVPLTLATTRVILLQEEGQLFAVPSLMIERTARIRECDLVPLEGRRAVMLDGHPVPIVELAAILERPRSTVVGEEWRGCFVLEQNEQRLAVLADRLLDEQEIVTKRLGWPLRRVRNVDGAAVLSSGETVVVLNPADLFKSGSQFTAGGRNAPALPERPADPESAQRRVLVVDDSLTTRTLERSILEAAGYETAVAADGAEALTVLRSRPIDLVISDVDMPRLDGFSLTTEIRRDERLHHIPVILVTSLEAREHRDRGVAAGADAYIVKSGFDQGQLLDTIGRLL